MHARANAGQIRCASSSRNASGSRGAGIRRMSRTSRIPRTSRALGRRSEGRPTRGALCTRLAGSRILHAGDQVLRLVLRQTETFVLLGVGKARVHGQRESRGVPARVEGIGCTGAPCRPQRQQQPAARGRPQPFRKQRAARREQLRVLAQRVACDQQRPVPCGAQLFGGPPRPARRGRLPDGRCPHRTRRTARDTPLCAWRRPPPAPSRARPHATRPTPPRRATTRPPRARRAPTPCPWPWPAQCAHR